MFTQVFFKGLGVGLFVAAMVIYSMAPRPTLYLEAQSAADGILSTAVHYDRFSPLPHVAIAAGSAQMLHHVVRRVTMSDGRSGVKVTALVTGVSKAHKREWI